MAKKKGKTAGAAPKKENRSEEDHVSDEEAQANREGRGATAGDAPGQMPTRCFDYPKGMPEEERKILKIDILMKNPEVLYEDTYKTGIRCNIIFFTHSGDYFRNKIEAAYPGSKCIQMANKLKLELSDGTTVSVFPSGKIMIQGKEENLVRFEKKFNQIKQADNRREEELKEKLEQMKLEEDDPN